MKSLFFILVFTTVGSIANAQMTSGHITFDVEVTSDNPKNESIVLMMESASLEVYFSKHVIRSEEVNYIGKQINIFNTASDSLLILLDFMGFKYALPMSRKEINLKTGMSNIPQFTVEIIENKQKRIADYLCGKVMVTDEKGNVTVAWYSKEIIVPQMAGDAAASWRSEIPGYVLEYSENQNDLEMHYTATEVKGGIHGSLLELTTPDGYDVVTFESMKELFKTPEIDE